MSLISLGYPTKHIIYLNLGEIGEMPCPTLFGGYVERLLRPKKIPVFPLTCRKKLGSENLFIFCLIFVF